MRVLALTVVTALSLNSAVLAQTLVVQPGEWEITVTFNSVEMANAPPAIANMLRGKTTTVRHCITPQDASRGPQDMLKSDKSCTFTRYMMAGGNFKSEMVCQRANGTITAESSGAFTPTSFTATGRTVSTGGMAMTVNSTTVGHRTGECAR